MTLQYALKITNMLDTLWIMTFVPVGRSVRVARVLLVWAPLSL